MARILMSLVYKIILSFGGGVAVLKDKLGDRTPPNMFSALEFLNSIKDCLPAM